MNELIDFSFVFEDVDDKKTKREVLIESGSNHCYPLSGVHIFNNSFKS